uniref:Thyroglobulin n=1 Tax=Haemonchus placei TaxID=6290 RepID=A0A0N4VX63_HAEPC
LRCTRTFKGKATERLCKQRGAAPAMVWTTEPSDKGSNGVRGSR